MSDRTFASISAALATLLDDGVASQINRSSVLLGVVPIRNTRGKNVSWDVKFGSAVGASIADGADVATFNADDKVPASLDYATMSDAFAISGKALSAALNTGNPQALVDLFGDDLIDSAARLAKGISRELYTGTGATDHIMGLCDNTAGVLLDTGTYANINRATYPQWASNIDSNGGVGRALTFALMRQMRVNIYTASGIMPDLIVTTPQLHGKYGSLFASNRHYNQDIYLRGQKITLSGGYGALFLDDTIPVIQDVDCPAGEMLFLNTSMLNVCQLPDPSQAVTQSQGSVSLVGDAEEQFGLMPGKLTARINPLGRAGDKYKFQLINYPQLKGKRPNAMGRIKDLDFTL
jgi:hypothetical protein